MKVDLFHPYKWVVIRDFVLGDLWCVVLVFLLGRVVLPAVLVLGWGRGRGWVGFISSHLSHLISSFSRSLFLFFFGSTLAFV